MKEIAPGLFHWTAMHPVIGHPVSSYFVRESGTLLDPMVPEDGLAWFHESGNRPDAIVLTNRHHDRQSQEFCDTFGLAPVQVPEPGLHEFADKNLEVRGYAAGEEVVSGIVVHEVGAIAPDDMALEIRSVGALAMADALVHFQDGVSFVRDEFMDDPEDTKVALAQSLATLLDIDFDTLLFAHGQPIVGGGKQMLREFLASQPAA
jgi:glyoxylase-like metal-dependent hydrolase (beta-lactamase superfamily II)